MARQFDISTSVIYKWRKACLTPTAQPSFTLVVLLDAPDLSSGRAQFPAIPVELSGGVRVSVAASAPASFVVATLKVLRS
ncbi:hypothetical protein [Phenylobacterium montanum]|uniref:Transposase n=1 Tax=Phenylobacterium montanum TaxID=2823693 RepID=A0A975IXK5_9CAUL|nr:hypothetical protein [Caulobacter sp. S6]QUD89506.1 hypothetical protein KCG34_06390 [Caulobacter sp. S6]